MRPLLLLLSSSLIISILGFDGSCKYWCKGPSHTFFCCSTARTGKHLGKGLHSFLLPWLWMHSSLYYTPWLYLFAKKLRLIQRCPPLRPRCPRPYGWYTYNVLQSWNTRIDHCHADGDCNNWEKCCYDVCLQHKTCKSSE